MRVKQDFQQGLEMFLGGVCDQYSVLFVPKPLQYIYHLATTAQLTNLPVCFVQFLSDR